ncbi:2TM domain-containing protein [Ichthyenterobacterium sp. W332]|uniref:2TM domain-containing protein n=1 Tax=Microcosmobacter mediterraneus TaxID=3075607 RepID=A0ABU2YMW7_9FLAO|nr:2TM domain-containing protein [Ichthyenterobacterium sp. W332]MDT0559157.1 2TM domain-containing protein [Ichthyenterobacterium sp. W332]
MELTMKMNEKYKDDGLYFRARHRAERLRKFYFHCIIFLIVNVVISLFKVNRNVNNGESFSDAVWDLDTFIVWIIWGIVLLIQTISVFGLPFILGKNWEEDKLKQFMDEDESINLKK